MNSQRLWQHAQDSSFKKGSGHSPKKLCHQHCQERGVSVGISAAPRAGPCSWGSWPIQNNSTCLFVFVFLLFLGGQMKEIEVWLVGKWGGGSGRSWEMEACKWFPCARMPPVLLLLLPESYSLEYIDSKKEKEGRRRRRRDTESTSPNYCLQHQAPFFRPEKLAHL